VCNGLVRPARRVDESMLAGTDFGTTGQTTEHGVNNAFAVGNGGIKIHAER